MKQPVRPFARPLSLVGLFATLFTFGALGFGLTAGCGRSALDDFDTVTTSGDDASMPPPADASIDHDAAMPDSAPPTGCSAASCPSGCCASDGTCQLGISDDACGTLGTTCQNCIGEGLDFCDGVAHSCAVSTGNCTQTCGGCCAGADGQTCLTGSSDTACGTGGGTCSDCTTSGSSCNASSGTCSTTTCGPGTCDGCCVGNVCVTGTNSMTCGANGEECVDCSTQGQGCAATAGDGGTGGMCSGAAGCSAANCTGCCVGDICLPGKDNVNCGTGGEMCGSCTTSGDVCTGVSTAGTGGFCQPECGPSNCTGCCKGNTCVTTSSTAACGTGGAECDTCGAQQLCTNDACVGNALCNTTNCTGCCVGDVCAVGTQNVHCGEGGNVCSDCTGKAEVCSNGTCAPPPCGPSNCAGCCDGNVCEVGSADADCGLGGNSCQKCSTLGEVCKAGGCAAPPPACTAATCPTGCCDPVNGCQAGFVDTACGSGAATCTNCTGMNSTCDTAVSPRVCVDQQTTCPAAFATCAGTTPTTAPTASKVCSTSELANAAAACSDGAFSAGCTQFFGFEATQDAACNSCLTTFRYDFSAKNGIYTCVAPFVSASCDDSTFCETSCESTSCSQCSAASDSTCLSGVRTGQCSSYLTTSETCTQAALNNATGGFCNPNTYADDFGAWLQGVGTVYCHNGT